MRELIIFECVDCKNRNYSSAKNKKKNTQRLELKKYCKACKKHTLHRELK